MTAASRSWSPTTPFHLSAISKLSVDFPLSSKISVTSAQVFKNSVSRRVTPKKPLFAYESLVVALHCRPALFNRPFQKARQG